MKKIFIVFAFILFCYYSFAQTDSIPDSINVNVLSAPSSPAFSLLGISPSSIQTPTDLTAFKLSIQNASNNFTSFPSSYAVDLSPASIFSVKNQTLDKFNSSKFQNVWWQSLNVSLGITKTDSNDVATGDSSSFTRFGIGVKFSIIRPKWIDSTQIYIDSIYGLQKLSLLEREHLFDTSNAVKAQDLALKQINNSVFFDPQQKLNAIDSVNKIKDTIALFLFNNFCSKIDSTAKVNLKRLTSGLIIKRKGGFLDFATGMVLDFPDEKFDNSIISKTGAWLTGGYQNTNNNGFSILGIARYLYQPDKIFADDSSKINTTNISTFDAGSKFDFRGANGKLSLNFEAVYRSVLNKNVIDPSWRAVFNASYDVGMNKLLTFSFGKNFDGTITKRGNLIAAVNFVAGFGSSKKINKR